MPGMGGKRAEGQAAGRRRKGKQARLGQPGQARRAAKATATQGRDSAEQDGAAAFGFGKSGAKELPEGFELPKELKDLL